MNTLKVKTIQPKTPEQRTRQIEGNKAELTFRLVSRTEADHTLDEPTYEEKFYSQFDFTILEVDYLFKKSILKF